MTVIIVSYDPVVSAYADHTVTLLDGRLDSGGRQPLEA
jgi:ABC-type lipoprotein export system ATPase subunit